MSWTADVAVRGSVAFLTLHVILSLKPPWLIPSLGVVTSSPGSRSKGFFYVFFMAQYTFCLIFQLFVSMPLSLTLDRPLPRCLDLSGWPLRFLLGLVQLPAQIGHWMPAGWMSGWATFQFKFSAHCFRFLPPSLLSPLLLNLLCFPLHRLTELVFTTPFSYPDFILPHEQSLCGRATCVLVRLSPSSVALSSPGIIGPAWLH